MHAQVITPLPDREIEFSEFVGAFGQNFATRNILAHFDRTQDRHTIANNAAEHFLKLLCSDSLHKHIMQLGKIQISHLQKNSGIG